MPPVQTQNRPQPVVHLPVGASYSPIIRGVVAQLAPKIDAIVAQQMQPFITMQQSMMEIQQRRSVMPSQMPPIQLR